MGFARATAEDEKGAAGRQRARTYENDGKSDEGDDVGDDEDADDGGGRERKRAASLRVPIAAIFSQKCLSAPSGARLRLF